MCCCLYSQCPSIDLLLTSFHAVTIKACLMPNIEFYFPSTELLAVLELLAMEWGGTTQLSPVGPDKLSSPPLFAPRALLERPPNTN
jgi:hypothetical protein